MTKIACRIILEIMGRPPKHVKEALNGLVQKMANEKGITLIDQKVHEPVPVEGSKDLFTTFAEVTVELESLEKYFAVVFSYMPSNIEILDPQELTLSNFDLNTLANQITQRLHSYDAITKKMLNERKILVDKLKEVAPQLFKKQQDPQPVQPTPKPAKKKAKKSKKKSTKKKAKK